MSRINRNHKLVVALGKRVKARRLELGYPQARLGPRAWISHIELGQNAPTIETLINLAIELDVTADYLLGLSD